jgi:hypothetical protein
MCTSETPRAVPTEAGATEKNDRRSREGASVCVGHWVKVNLESTRIFFSERAASVTELDILSRKIVELKVLQFPVVRAPPRRAVGCLRFRLGRRTEGPADLSHRLFLRVPANSWNNFAAETVS